MSISQILFLSIFGVLGILSRYSIDVALKKFHFFPLSTLIVNILGCFILGFLSIALQDKVSDQMLNALTIGFCGGLTTFSTFAFQVIQLNHLWKSGLYIVLSVSLGVLFVVLGQKLATSSFS